MRLATGCFVLLASIATATCGEDRDTPTGPTRPVVPSSPFIGTWTGSMAGQIDGQGTLRLAITEQVAITLVGSWEATFADSSRNDNGWLTASVDGSSILLTLISTSRTCSVPFGPSPAPVMTAANLVHEGSRLSGGYFSVSCGTPRDGRMELTKQ